MSELKLIVTRLVMVYIFLLLIVYSSKATVYNSDGYNYVSRDKIEQRIDELPSAVDLRYTPEVHNIINNYIRRYRRSSEILLGRVERYFPMYEVELEQKGLPREIKYLSVVESHLKPRAVSIVGAVGLWQFMRGTGRMYGLTINGVVDERRDPLKSTQAAAAYLEDLYEEFGDWTLAMAAYNCGPGGVRKAKRRSGGETFWEIRPYLPKETRRYIPKFVAIAYVMNYFQTHGLQPNNREGKMDLATARIYDYMSFSQISKITGIDTKTIRKLNPAFLRGYIPKNSKGYYLTLPEEGLYSLLSRTEGFDNLVYNANRTGHVKGRLYMYGSMRNRVIEMSELDKLPTLNVSESLNGLRAKPDMPGVPLNQNNRQGENAQEDFHALSNRYRYYKLMAQQSLNDVAELFEISLEHLIHVNEIDLNNPPTPGTMIKVGMTDAGMSFSDD